LIIAEAVILEKKPLGRGRARGFGAAARASRGTSRSTAALRAAAGIMEAEEGRK
jgi:hypothetical protein